MAGKSKNTEVAALTEDASKQSTARRGYGLNRVILVGNLTADLELRHTSSGLPYARFRVATNDREMAEFHSILVWRGTAEAAARLGKKGSRVYIEGRLHNSSWRSKDGQQQYRVEVVAETIRLLQNVIASLN